MAWHHLPRNKRLFFHHFSSSSDPSVLATLAPCKTQTMKKLILLLSISSIFCVLALFGAMNRLSEDCPTRLAKQGYKFDLLADFQQANCGVVKPIKLYSTPTSKMTQPVTLSCSFAETLGNWTAELGAKRISHVGGYNCRKIAGSFLMSQHSFGNAIDITHVDGINIQRNWREVSKSACQHFTHVLTPGTDPIHANHIHLDNGWGIPCWLSTPIKQQINKLYNNIN